MIRLDSSTGHSSDVRLSLQVGGERFDVSQVGPDRCRLRDPRNAPPGPAELTITIDGKSTTEIVILADGVRDGVPDVTFG